MLGTNASAWSIGAKFPEPANGDPPKTFRQIQGTAGALVHELPPGRPAATPPQGDNWTYYNLGNEAQELVAAGPPNLADTEGILEARGTPGLVQRIQRLEDENEMLKSRLLALEARLLRE